MKNNIPKDIYDFYNNRITDLDYLKYTLSNIHELLSAIRLNISSLNFYHSKVSKIEVDETLLFKTLDEIKEKTYVIDNCLRTSGLRDLVSDKQNEILSEIKQKHNVYYSDIFDERKDFEYALKIKYKWLSDEYLHESGIGLSEKSKDYEITRRKKRRREKCLFNILCWIVFIAALWLVRKI